MIEGSALGVRCGTMQPSHGRGTTVRACADRSFLQFCTAGPVHDRDESTMTRRPVIAALLLAFAPLACADPCVDDGVNQEKKDQCPGQAASQSGTEDGTTGKIGRAHV